METLDIEGRVQPVQVRMKKFLLPKEVRGHHDPSLSSVWAGLGLCIERVAANNAIAVKTGRCKTTKIIRLQP